MHKAKVKSLYIYIASVNIYIYTCNLGAYTRKKDKYCDNILTNISQCKEYMILFKEAWKVELKKHCFNISRRILNIKTFKRYFNDRGIINFERNMKKTILYLYNIISF